MQKLDFFALIARLFTTLGSKEQAMRRSVVIAAAGSASAAARLRTPLIKFTHGKRTLPAKAPAAAPTPAPATVAASAKPVKVGTGVDFATLKGKAWFGRPLLSEKEMLAIESGGASALP